MRVPAPELFNIPGHYYSSYPSLNHWNEDLGSTEYEEAFTDFIRNEDKPLHLYVHIPFCAKLCFYCLCNIVVTNEREKIQFFLDHLLKEISNLGRFYERQGKVPNIREIHLGGGTPSHLDRDQFSQLCDGLATLYDGLDEFAMEIDPRTIKEGDLQFYAAKGITRISFGVQDFNRQVQEAINRVQPFEMVQSVMNDRKYFKGVNFDLLYGLPKQTLETLRKTVEQTIELSPDRITLLKYCHAPDVRRHMKLIKEEDLTPKDDLPEMFTESISSLIKAGYEWIGLDHFSKHTDSLAVAQVEGKLHRTFNGFAPGRTRDMIGLGPTSTAAFGRVYAQSHYDLNDYYSLVNQGKFPIQRGYYLTHDDHVRREVIFQLMCQQEAVVNSFYFRKELETLSGMSELCELFDSGRGVTRITLTGYGRLLSRNVCKVFDVKDVAERHFKIAQKTITRRAAYVQA